MMGLAKVHTIGRWLGWDLNPDLYAFVSKAVRCEGSKSRSSGARKLVGDHLEGTPRNWYLDRQKHESARGPRRRRCHQSLRHCRGGHGGESDAMWGGTIAPLAQRLSRALQGSSQDPMPDRGWESRLCSACAHWKPATMQAAAWNPTVLSGPLNRLRQEFLLWLRGQEPDQYP